MNQEDHSAVPIQRLTDKPNFAPYDVVPNQVPFARGAGLSLRRVERGDRRGDDVGPARAAGL